jgi:8-oxo-dGTP diphosphatase
MLVWGRKREETQMVDTSKLKTMKQATLCFLVDGSAVALAKMLRGPFKGHLNGLGGEPEGPDVVIETAREVAEECGAILEPKDILPAAILDFYNYKDGGWRRVRVFTSIATRWSGALRAGDGMGKPQWHPMSNLPFEQMLPSDRLWLPRILQGERLEGEVWHNKELTGLEKEPVFAPLTTERLHELWHLE